MISKENVVHFYSLNCPAAFKFAAPQPATTWNAACMFSCSCSLNLTSDWAEQSTVSTDRKGFGSVRLGSALYWWWAEAQQTWGLRAERHAERTEELLHWVVLHAKPAERKQVKSDTQTEGEVSFTPVQTQSLFSLPVLRLFLNLGMEGRFQKQEKQGGRKMWRGKEREAVWTVEEQKRQSERDVGRVKIKNWLPQSTTVCVCMCVCAEVGFTGCYFSIELQFFHCSSGRADWGHLNMFTVAH